jgi:hypothetical protein
MRKSKADAPDAEKPEWIEEDMRNAISFSELPEASRESS